MDNLKRFLVFTLLLAVIVIGALYILQPDFGISQMKVLATEAVCLKDSDSSMFKTIKHDQLKYPVGQLHVPQPWAMKQSRSDVLTVTHWLAPIVWEGTFNTQVINRMYQPLNITVAACIFAVGNYIRLLPPLLQSAEKHFMIGYRVNYYIFTDQPNKVPRLALGSGRSIIVLPFPSFNRWQEISLRRMEFIRKAIEDRIRHEAHYVFNIDSDTLFENHFGAEALGELVGSLHPWYYYLTRNQFTNERRPASRAHVPDTEGDFYYIGALYGGSVDAVYRLTKTIEQQLNIDKQNNIEAVWQEESHLNLYFLEYKPTKVLSPEYVWDKLRGNPPEHIRVVRLATIIKDKKALRPN
ncbi:hypothetical protein ACEWY4_026016 [Coilia grayii]|uniref:Globoside alpha-1,3-N-acetylgalactosaminyltransferase 1-like n=1 Tax=Coilia grayii TaxID=363190 RepID=A0ABD1IVN2_9TELE